MAISLDTASSSRELEKFTRSRETNFNRVQSRPILVVTGTMRVPYVRSSGRCRYVHNVDISRDLRSLAPDKAAVRTTQLPAMCTPAAESSPKVVEVAEEVKVLEAMETVETVKKPVVLVVQGEEEEEVVVTNHQDREHTRSW